MEKKILELFNQSKKKWNLGTMARELGLRSHETRSLRRTLKKMQKEGLIERHRGVYKLAQAPQLLKGEYLSTSLGFGFVRPEEGGPDIFIPPRASAGAMNGDKVEVEIRETKDGRLEGRVRRIIRAKPTILGYYQPRYGHHLLVPLEDPAYGEIQIDISRKMKLEEGMIIEIERHTGRLLQVFGHPDEPLVDTHVVIKRFGLRTEYPPEALKEAACLSSRINQEARRGRKDFRRWLTITIDGENAQDFDDAISIKKLPNSNFLLGVHIADVSHFVPPGTALDEEAKRRGTSVYFPDLTLHMFPERLATNLCSLRPRVTRLTFSVLLEIDQKGEVVKTEFCPSLIKTVERMTYSSVYKIFQGDKEESQKYAHLLEDLFLMRELASLLRERRESLGSLNFDLLEPELIYREGKLAEIASFEQNEAHHLIEEFMVAANEAVATFFSDHGLPAIYRVHPPPAVGDLEELRQKVLALGLYLPRGDQVKPHDLQRLLRAASGRPEEKFVHVQVLRALRIAHYSDENIGHYGLAKNNYTHFTSPIRRYSDLVVHRLLKAALTGEPPPGLISELGELAWHCSACERQAEAAERELIEWRIFRFLKSKLGEEVKGFIVDFNRVGLVVELEDYFVQGLLAYHDLRGDHDWRRSGEGIVGKRTGRRLRLGDQIEVILAYVDPILRRINLVLSPSFWGKKK
ncbi:MAG: ribonuclease R [Candidatus Aminicenantes bacterium]|nr:ribonuclease R [Candidatus Aminicenantes bacterium]